MTNEKPGKKELKELTNWKKNGYCKGVASTLIVDTNSKFNKKNITKWKNWSR